MAVPARGTEADAAPDDRNDTPSPETSVSMHSTRPDRTVFVEEDNADGWIATDLTVSLDR